MSPASAAYLSALGVVRWRPRGGAAPSSAVLAAAAMPAVEPATETPAEAVTPATGWRCLRTAAAPRLAFLVARAPEGEEAVLAARIASALGVAEDALSLWAGAGALPAELAALPMVGFGVGAEAATVQAPALSELLASPGAKAVLWRELQARILPRL